MTAYSGQEWLEHVCRQAIDVIVLDVMMPGMDGVAVCAALRHMPAGRSIPVILVTARDDMPTWLAGLELGVSDCIVQPVKARNDSPACRPKVRSAVICASLMMRSRRRLPLTTSIAYVLVALWRRESASSYFLPNQAGLPTVVGV